MDIELNLIFGVDDFRLKVTTLSLIRIFQSQHLFYGPNEITGLLHQEKTRKRV